jgi:hypothetical protein
MIFFKRPLLIIAFALLIIPKDSFGQYQFEVKPFFSYLKDLKRYELSFNAILPNGYFQGVQQVNSGSYIGDTTIKRTMAGVVGFGGSIGLSMPIKATGHISCWAVVVALGFNTYSWTNLNSTYGADGSLVAPTSNILTAATTQISLPIGIDWMVGNHAIDTKRLGLGTAMGLGVIPAYNMTSVSNGSGLPTGSRFGFTPYAKIEGSFFIGWDVKIRAMYTMGNVSLIEVNRPIPGMTDGPFKVVSTSNIMVSLVLMPFSGGWRETKWWNTYDTYNKHDRLN